MNWGNEETPVSVADMEKFNAEMERRAAEIADQREKCAEAASVKKEEDAILERLENAYIDFLEKLGKKNYSSKVGLLSVAHKVSFALPRTPEERQAYFKYLQDLDVYASMISVNSNTHNSFCKQQFEAAQAEGRGVEFAIPGVPEPTIKKTLSFRKSS